VATTRLPSPLNAALHTAAVYPFRTAISLPLSASQMRAVLSKDPVTNRLLSLLMPGYIADHRQHQRCHASQQPPDTPLQPCGTPLLLRSCILRPAYCLKLRALLPKPRGLRLLAGPDKGALDIGDLGCCRIAGGHPCLRRVDFVPTQKQRFGTSPPVPARRDFPEPGVLANPVEVLPQRLS